MKTLFFILVKFISLAILTRGGNEFCCKDGKTSLTQEKVRFKKTERKWWFLCYLPTCSARIHMAMCYSDKSVFHLVSNNRSSGRPDRHPKAKQLHPLSSVQTIVIFFIFLVPLDPSEWHTNQPTNNIWQQIFFLVCNGVVDCPPSKTGLGGWGWGGLQGRWRSIIN